jgi:NADPH:quinone reductase-like Zn-dependent oxidoreductase
VKAARVREVGAVVELGEVGEPSAETIEVLAAPINPIDLAVSRGVLATRHPELPYVPDCDAVGRAGDGRVVWIFGGLGRISHGAIAGARRSATRTWSRCPRADAALAAGLGIAGLARSPLPCSAPAACGR